MDLSGTLIIKAQLRDDMRKIPIHNLEITYDELIFMMQRVFKGKLMQDDEILLKYKDEDGDFITIVDESDLSLAIQTNKILQIKVLVQGDTWQPITQNVKALQESITNLPNRTSFSEPGDRSALVAELRRLRDHVTSLADRLDSFALSQLTGGASSATAISTNSNTMAGSQNHPDSVNEKVSKEFDPLSRPGIQAKIAKSTNRSSITNPASDAGCCLNSLTTSPYPDSGPIAATTMHQRNSGRADEDNSECRDEKPCPNQEVGQLVPPGNPETSSFESNAPAAPLPPPPTAIVSASAPSPPPLHPTISSALGILPPPPPPLASATDPARYPSLALPPSRQLVPPPPHTTAPPPPNLGDISPDGSAHPVITSVESSFLRQGPTFQPPHTSFPGQANQPVMPPPQMTQNFPLPPPQQLQQQMQRPPLQQPSGMAPAQSPYWRGVAPPSGYQSQAYLSQLLLAGQPQPLSGTFCPPFSSAGPVRPGGPVTSQPPPPPMPSGMPSQPQQQIPPLPPHPAFTQQIVAPSATSATGVQPFQHGPPGQPSPVHSSSQSRYFPPPGGQAGNFYENVPPSFGQPRGPGSVPPGAGNLSMPPYHSMPSSNQPSLVGPPGMPPPHGMTPSTTAGCNYPAGAGPLSHQQGFGMAPFIPGGDSNSVYPQSHSVKQGPVQVYPMPPSLGQHSKPE